MEQTKRDEGDDNNKEAGAGTGTDTHNDLDINPEMKENNEQLIVDHNDQELMGVMMKKLFDNIECINKKTGEAGNR